MTLAVARRPVPGSEPAFESWVHGIVEAASTFPGHQGASILRPAPSRPEYLILLRFASVADLQRWQRSESCARWVARGEELTAGPAQVRELHGLEAWFDAGASQGPPRWKMAILTFVALYPALVFATLALAPVIGTWPTPLRLLATSLILVPLMTWVLMPVASRLARSWLHP